MRLDTITLQNYRLFKELTCTFDPQLTVIVAPNGQGKTTLLDAIKVALWPYVRGFDLGSTTNDVTNIQIDDVRFQQIRAHEMNLCLPVRLSASGQMQMNESIQKNDRSKQTSLAIESTHDLIHAPSSNVPWESIRYRDSLKKNTKTKEVEAQRTWDLSQAAKTLQKRIFLELQTAPDDLPMLGYYGTGRLWSQKKLTANLEKASSEEASRTFAYRDCMDPGSSYKHFSRWFTRIFKSLRDAQIRKFERSSLTDVEIAPDLMAPVHAIQQATDVVLKSHTGWHELQYSTEHEELVLHHDAYGQLRVSQLSDGIRNMLALVGDIAYRCYKLNAHHGQDAPRRTHGVVLIDEVDMHLHPDWQQTVLTDLITAFPLLQFIVTTHSPQVLTSVDARCIRILRNETDLATNTQHHWIDSVTIQTRGVASADLLARIMGTDPVPDVPEARQLSHYLGLIAQNLHHEPHSLELRAQLISHFGAEHPALENCDRMIRLQAFKQTQLLRSKGH